MRSTLGQLKDFKESTIWMDMKSELHVWLDKIHEELENLDGEFSERVLHRLGGCALAVRNTLMLPDVLIGLAEDDQLAAMEARQKLERGGNKDGRGK